MNTSRNALTVIVAAAATLVATGGVAPAQTTSPLSPARYTALDTGYTLAIPVERRSTAANTEKLRGFCDSLDLTDPLLAVRRESCLASLQASHDLDAFEACTNNNDDSCTLPTTQRARSSTSKVVRIRRKVNRVTDAEVPAGACRTALRSSRNSIHSLELIRDALDVFVRALRSGSTKNVNRGGRLLGAGLRLAAKVPSETRQRKAFRAACGPAPASTAPPPVAPAR